MVQGISFDGLASGLETDDIIQQLMKIERIPVHRIEARKEEAELTKTAWQEVNTQLSVFEEGTTALRNRSTFEAREVTSSREDILSASADPGAENFNYQIRVMELAQAHRVAADEGVEDVTEALNLEGIIEINGEEITISAEDTLQDIRNAVNHMEETDVRATIMDGRLIITGMETGAKNQMNIEDVEGDVLKQLAILNQDDEFLREVTEARDSHFEVDGMKVTRAGNQNIDDVIDHVVLNLHAADKEEVFNLDISQDSDKILSELSGFVDSYNNVQEYLGSLSREEGLLQGDMTVRLLSSNLRREVMDEIDLDDSELVHFSQLGIEIDKDGVMSLDEQRAREVVMDHPDDLQHFFTAREEEHGDQGVARRLHSVLRNYLRYGDGILAREEKSIEGSIERFDRQIESRERRLERRESNLRRQFTRMETMLSEYQAQGDWIQGQLDNLFGSSN